MATDTRIQQAINAIKLNQLEAAKDILSGILIRQVNNTQARWLFVQCLEQQVQLQEAQSQLKLLLKNCRKDITKINELASHYLKMSYPMEPVLRAYRKFIDHKPDDTNALYNYAWYLSRNARYEEALAAYERALEQDISGADEVHLNMAAIYMDHLGDHEKARDHLEFILSISPKHLGAWHNLGNMFEQLGERDEAARCFENCLVLDPSNESALARLSDTRKFESNEDPVLGRLQAHAMTSRNSDIHFALGRAWDQLSRFDDAWKSMARANEIDQEAFGAYNPERIEKVFRKIAESTPQSWYDNIHGTSDNTVFICGMFRSGSTLLEQMLAAHPSFTAGGESEFFPRLFAGEFRLYPVGLDELEQDQLTSWRKRHAAMVQDTTQGKTRLTDKRLENFLYAGLIKAILPSAKFIFTERDWRDNAVSIFATRLGPKQDYARKLEDIRHYIGLQQELTNHWASIMGPDLVRVKYEDLVRHPEATLKGLLENLGEEWDDCVLSFDQQSGAVQTASVWQVREPLHDRSIGRWKNYSRHFDVLEEDGPST